MERRALEMVNCFEFKLAQQECQAILRLIEEADQSFKALELLQRRVINKVQPLIRDRIRAVIHQACLRFDHCSYQKAIECISGDGK